MTHFRHPPSFGERTSHEITEANPHSTRSLHHQQPMVSVSGPESDLRIQAAEATRMQRFPDFTLVAHTGRTVEHAHSDIARNLFLTADETIAYGSADLFVPSREKHLRGAR